ncbi:uncharacterized protein LOC119738146 [Patiria miniata]|uniref:Uncharacterized protein n=1 Tax=Patiria miniata TaxID=46514 RepID=A0A914AZ75_PATMI|nr:uncharacterized protein LOC119738146 [Patiria miniata]
MSVTCTLQSHSQSQCQNHSTNTVKKFRNYEHEKVQTMAGSRMNKRLFVILLIFLVICCLGWVRLLFILTSYDLEPRHVPVSQLVAFSTRVDHDHDWYHSVCFRGIEHELSISTLDDFIEKWAVAYTNTECSDMYNTFSSIYSVSRRSGQLIIPETFQTKLLRWLGNDEELLKEAKLQFITSIYNKYTHEHTLLNPLRAKRPGVNDLEDIDEYMEDLVKKSEKNCDFCDYKYKTAEDTFGRIESDLSATAANAFKMDGFHALVILKNQHDPRLITEELFLDAMHVSMKWFMKVYDTDKQYRYPHMIWDSLPKASASQIHPHAQITLSPVRHYGGIEHFRKAAIKYGRENHGKNYFTDLIKIHNALGLTVTLGNASALAYLTPKKDNDVMILSKTPCQDFFRLVYYTLRAFMDLKLYAWSMAMFLPKLEPYSTPDYDDIPAIARIVTRGPPSSSRSDVGAMELFSINNVNVDPFAVVQTLKDSVEKLGYPHSALQDAQAQKQALQQQILELQQKQLELDKQVQQQEQQAPIQQQQQPQQQPLQLQQLQQDGREGPRIQAADAIVAQDAPEDGKRKPEGNGVAADEMKNLS